MVQGVEAVCIVAPRQIFILLEPSLEIRYTFELLTRRYEILLDPSKPFRQSQSLSHSTPRGLHTIEGDPRLHGGHE